LFRYFNLRMFECDKCDRAETALVSFGSVAPGRPLGTSRRRRRSAAWRDQIDAHRVACSNAQSEEACNHDDDDYDANNVKNVHCVLL
jgi:hypothetical protein